ncbi:MAG: hypothetical protein ACUVV0_11130 [Anaerolineae bacterium]
MQARKKRFLSRLGSVFRREEEGESQPSFFSIIDLGTEYVKTLVVEIKDRKAHILGYGQAQYRGSHLGPRAMAAICDRALRQAEDMTEKTFGRLIVPDRAAFAVPLSWVQSGVYTVEHHRSCPNELIRPKELEGVLQRVQRLAFQRLRQGLSADPKETVALPPILVEARIDGHRVTDPIGFHGGVLTLTVFNALTRREALATLETIAEELELEPPLPVLESRALACSPAVPEAIILDIGAHLTAISIAREGCPVAAGSLAFGGQAFNRQLASHFRLTLPRAEALKMAYSRGELNEEMAASVRCLVAPLVESWLFQVERKLGEIWKQTFPPHIYLCGGGSELREALLGARDFAWMSALPFERCPEVHLLTTSDIPHILNRVGPAAGQEGVLAMALASWVAQQKDSKEDLPTQLLYKVTRALTELEGWRI